MASSTDGARAATVDEASAATGCNGFDLRGDGMAEPARAVSAPLGCCRSERPRVPKARAPRAVCAREGGRPAVEDDIQ